MYLAGEERITSKASMLIITCMALSVLLWVVQDRHATMGKHIVILVSVCNAQYSSVVRKLLQSLASDEFKHLAYNKVIPQVKRASQ